MFRIKICGITRPEDALFACEAGADAIGLNFAPPSPRAIDISRAQEISAAVHGKVLRVGVFVNASADLISQIVRQAPLDMVQLHGDEPAELLLELGEIPIMKAFRLRTTDVTPIADFLAQATKLGRMPAAVLLDAYSANSYGGTGQTADWSAAAEYQRLPMTPQVPFVLAGGLTAENVAQAIRQVRPWAVDTASGVESAPGIKDPQQIAAFVAAVRGAFGS